MKRYFESRVQLLLNEKKIPDQIEFKS